MRTSKEVSTADEKKERGVKKVRKCELVMRTSKKVSTADGEKERGVLGGLYRLGCLRGGIEVSSIGQSE